MSNDQARSCHLRARHTSRLAGGVIAALALLGTSVATTSWPAWAGATSPETTTSQPTTTSQTTTTLPPSSTASPPTGPTTTGKPASGTGKSAPGRSKTTTTTVPPPPVEPNPGTGALLEALVADERQMTSLTAVADAQSYLRQAGLRSESAAARVVTALASWEAAKSAQAHALVVQAAAIRKVGLYQQALYELGLAEYTGQTAQSSNDLKATEHQVVVVQFGEVAADDTDSGLHRAQWDLAVAEGDVRAARAEVSGTRQGTERAAHALALAQVQVETSRLALLEARQWATIAGRAPAQPIVEVARLEGPLGPRHQAAWVIFALPSTTTTLVPPTTGRGGPKTCPPTTLALVPNAAAPTSTTESAVMAPDSPPTAVGPPTDLTPPAVVATATTTTTGTTTTTLDLAPTSAPGAPATGGAGPTKTTKAGAVAGLDCSAPNLSKYGPSILGPSLLTVSQVEGWFAATGAEPNITVPIDTLVNDYYKAGQLTGVRADLAFAQSVVETGYFSFPAYGQDPVKYNNFAGIGACDSCKHGFHFASAMDGVMAQQELLGNYATPSEMASGPEGGSDNLGVGGCCQTWMGLSGVWATNINYGYAILSVYKLMVNWALQSELQQVGLVPGGPGVVGASGPSQTEVTATTVPTTELEVAATTVPTTQVAPPPTAVPTTQA
jgi:hypothetical protein